MSTTSLHRAVPMTRALLACVLFFSSVVCFGQFDAASVLGFLRDGSGAAIGGGQVKLTNTATGVSQSTVADSEGRYQFDSVLIGTYVVASDATGFQHTETPPFQLTVNARQRVDVNLRLNGATESVNVSSAATLLETETSSRGQVIGQLEVENLPLNGRSYADLALLVPGVRKSVLENQSTTSREASFNVNGQRSAFNNFLLDGLDNNTYGTSNQGFANENIPPSPDAVEEFRIETDNYSAEYGRAAGAVINVSIRRGSNQFHGGAWEFNRNTALNAIGPFQPSGGVKPTFIRNQFGGRLGGPIFKDRTFFFADYEGTRQITKVFSAATLPNAEQRSGTFLLHRANGTTAPIPLQNPLTGRVYANGVIPMTDSTPFARAVLAALPANVNTGFANNYINFPRGTITDDKGDLRLDHKFNDRVSLFARFSRHQATIFDPAIVDGLAGGSSNNNNVHIYNQQIAFGGTYTITPTSLLDARMGVGWNEGGKTPFGLGQPSLLIANGITNGIPTDPRISRTLNGQNISGFFQLGAQTSNPQFQNPFVIDPKINYTFLHGRHSIKAGYEFQSISTDIDDFNPVYGQDNYSGAYSTISAGTPTDPANASLAGTQISQARNLADFLFGNRSSYQLNNFVVIGLRQKMNFMYVQDDIKVTPALTINAGLRYELVTPQYTDGNHQANFDPTTNTLIQAKDGSIYNRALVNMKYNNIGPRFGLAYSATPRTVIRSGYGISYTQFNREGGENLLAYNGPYIVGATINQVSPKTTNQCTGDTQDQTLCFRTTQQGYSVNLVSPAAFNPLKVQSRYIPKDNPTGYVESYHLTVQQQLPGQVVMDVAYVGSHSVHLMVLGDQNQAVPQTLSATCAIAAPSAPGGLPTYTTSGCASLQARRPISNFAGIEVATGIGSANYNALQLKVEKRYINGLYLLNSFTWSRGFDIASGHLETAFGDNSRVNLANPRGDYGPSGYDQPLNNTTSLLYDLPFGKGRHFGNDANYLVRAAAGGWQATVINQATSGLPVNFTYNINSSFTVSDLPTYRPNKVGNPLAGTTRVKTATALNGYFNPLAIALPTGSSPFGTASRNAVRGPVFNQLDFGLHKAFDLGSEARNLEFRAETFNIFNHVNYTAPDGNRSNGSFGSITQAFPARQLQLALKLLF